MIAETHPHLLRRIWQNSPQNCACFAEGDDGMDQPSTLAPVQERSLELDVLRGFAVFGILLVNILFFSGPYFQWAVPIEVWPDPVNAAARWLIAFFAESKFFPMFSFLFGLGFMIQMERAEAKGIKFGGFFRRRMLILFLIGLAHALLLSYGDILTQYALLGWLLLAFRKVKPRTHLIWAGVLLAVALLINGALGGLSLLAQSATPDYAQYMPDPDAEIAADIAAFGEGSFAEIFSRRLYSFIGYLFAFVFFFSWVVLAMFMLGAYAGKRHLFDNISEHRSLFRQVLVWGLIIGVPANAFYATAKLYTALGGTSLLGTAGSLIEFVGGPALSLAMIAGITLLLQQEVWRKRLSVLAPVGRMALTNYVLQSVICNLIFYNYGLGLFGQVGPAALIAITIAIYIAQMLFSTWWMRQFRYGPLEWLWRSLTYRQFQPIRHQALKLAADSQA
jgi:uncharacterized protein